MFDAALSEAQAEGITVDTAAAVFTTVEKSIGKDLSPERLQDVISRAEGFFAEDYTASWTANYPEAWRRAAAPKFQWERGAVTFPFAGVSKSRARRVRRSERTGNRVGMITLTFTGDSYESVNAEIYAYYLTISPHADRATPGAVDPKLAPAEPVVPSEQG